MTQGSDADGHRDRGRVWAHGADAAGGLVAPLPAFDCGSVGAGRDTTGGQDVRDLAMGWGLAREALWSSKLDGDA